MAGFLSSMISLKRPHLPSLEDHVPPEGQVALGIIRMHQALEKMQRAKINHQRAMIGLPPLQDVTSEVYGMLLACIRAACLQFWCPCLVPLPGKDRSNLCTNGTAANDLIKSIFGFIGGTLVSLILFLVLGYVLQVHLSIALWTCIIIGTTFSLGMAFFTFMRCLVITMFPGLVSLNARCLLFVFIISLLFKYPTHNIHNNIHLISQCVGCIQEDVYNVTAHYVDVALNPIIGIVNDFNEMITKLIRFADDIRDSFTKVANMFHEIYAALQNVQNWLLETVDQCNERLSQPYFKCRASFDSAYADCRQKLAVVPGLLGLCNIVTGFEGVCDICKITELFCLISVFFKKVIYDVVPHMVIDAVDNIHDFFYVSVKFEYSFNYSMQQSQSYGQVEQEVMEDIRQRLRPLQHLIYILEPFSAVIIILLLCQPVTYLYQFFFDTKYDNVYVTRYIQEIDDRRDNDGRPTLLPLTGQESQKYVTLMTWSLTSNEQNMVLAGVFYSLLLVIYTTIVYTFDFGLWFLLHELEELSQLNLSDIIPHYFKLSVDGTGILARMYRALVSTLDPVNTPRSPTDIRDCVPHPSKPNIAALIFLYTLIFALLISTLISAYLLRFRHYVVEACYPEKARERALWLYMHILRRRPARMRAVFSVIRDRTKNKYKPGLINRLAASCPLLEPVLSFLGRKQVCCIGCMLDMRITDPRLIRCQGFGCPGIYCQSCFDEANGICALCTNIISHADEDVSSEKDSSDDDYDPIITQRSVPLSAFQHFRKEPEDVPEPRIRVPIGRALPSWQKYIWPKTPNIPGAGGDVVINNQPFLMPREPPYLPGAKLPMANVSSNALPSGARMRGIRPGLPMFPFGFRSPVPPPGVVLSRRFRSFPPENNSNALIDAALRRPLPICDRLGVRPLLSGSREPSQMRRPLPICHRFGVRPFLSGSREPSQMRRPLPICHRLGVRPLLSGSREPSQMNPHKQLQAPILIPPNQYQPAGFKQFLPRIRGHPFVGLCGPRPPDFPRHFPPSIPTGLNTFRYNSFQPRIRTACFLPESYGQSYGEPVAVPQMHATLLGTTEPGLSTRPRLILR